MYTTSVRGATTAENTYESIINNTKIMLQEIIEKNNIEIDDIISIIFTCTKDLTKSYPAVAARQLGITQAGLMCVSEQYVEGSLPFCVRTLVNINSEKPQSKMKHIYLGEAKRLRPDIVNAAGFQIGIDGPAGSGKSTIAKRLAKELGFIYIDTGAMYRAVGLYCRSKGADLSNANEVAVLLDEIEIELKYSDGVQLVFLNGTDVTTALRTAEAGNHASAVAAHSAVRQKLVGLQKKLAEDKNIIMDGRDICSHVLKNADVKIYLDATVEARAKRRCGELQQLKRPFDYEVIKKEIADRDFFDKNREITPLAVAPDAAYIDTSDIDEDTVVETILRIVYAKGIKCK